jgi:hypothetical protein
VVLLGSEKRHEIENHGPEYHGTWPLTDTVAPDRRSEFVAEVREAIDRIWSLLPDWIRRPVNGVSPIGNRLAPKAYGSS